MQKVQHENIRRDIRKDGLGGVFFPMKWGIFAHIGRLAEGGTGGKGVGGHAGLEFQNMQSVTELTKMWRILQNLQIMGEKYWRFENYSVSLSKF